MAFGSPSTILSQIQTPAKQQSSLVIESLMDDSVPHIRKSPTTMTHHFFLVILQHLWTRSCGPDPLLVDVSGSSSILRAINTIFLCFFFFFLDVNGVLRWDRNLFLGSRSHQFSYFPPEAMLTLGAGVDTPRFSPAVTVSGFQAVESQRQLYLSPLHFLMLYSLMNSSCKSST